MAETHELRLKIDAAAARTGSREFTAAIEAVKRAVRDLERDSTGAFTKLRKSIKDTAALGQLKTGVDKQSIRDLNSFAAGHEQIAKSAATSEKSVKTLARTVQGLADAYRFAKGTADEFNASILKTNSALMRQIQLASQARSAVRQIRTAPTATAEGTTTSIKRGSTSTATAEVAGLSTATGSAAKSVQAAQSAIQRSIATSRTAVESLTVSLMKLDGFGAMSQLHRDFQNFTNAASKAGITTKELAAAKERLATSVANARTSLVTLTEKSRDSARVAGDVAKAERAAEQATKARASAQLSAASAVRSAESDAQRLINRLREMGDSRGIHQINQALIQLKASLSGSTKSVADVRAAMGAFAQTTSQAKAALVSYEAAQRAAKAEAKAFAAEQRRVADSARKVEREMRSIAGANAAAARSFRDATGNMRGLENAFSGTFQAGSLFRNMLGSITLGTFTRTVFEAGNALDQFRVTMEVATGSASLAMKELDYVDGLAARLGVNLQSARDNYSKFAVSASIAGVSAGETQKVFESVSTALSVMGKGTVDQNLAFMALEQMMSKGTVSSEELRQQLGERLPGAVSMMAEALGVTMEELGKMLKAGEIVSSEALPKFADVLMEKFGPGLQNATLRAGNNLQKLRNEIQMFLEEVAQSGFMQELAVQFRTLTDILADGKADGAARKLGEGLAAAARIGGDALGWLIENIEDVGRAVKAVAIGIVARQIALMGNAVATSAMQMTGYVAAWLNGQRGMTAAEVATAKHTAALNLNTAALTRNAAMATRAGTASLVSARGQEQAARAALTARRSTLALSGVMGTLGGIAGATATAMGVFSRALSIVAPVVGIAVTALMLIPGAMDMIGLGADGMANQIEAALARSGAKFDEFGDAVRQNTAVGMMEGLVHDITVLEGATRNLAASGAGASGWLFDVSKMDAITLAVGKYTMELGTLDNMLASIGLSMSGLDTTGMDNMGRGAQLAVQALHQSLKDVISGQASATDMQGKLNAALARFPDARPEILALFSEMLNGALQVEQALVNDKHRLTELYGTSGEKTLGGFIKLAEQVYKTGNGMDELIERQKTLGETNPAMAATLEGVMKSWNEAFAGGKTSLEWAKSVSDMYDGTADRILSLRDDAREASAAFNTSIEAMRQKASETTTALSSMQTGDGLMSWAVLTPVPQETIDSYNSLISQFVDFQSSGGMQVSLESLNLFSQAMATGTPSVQAFTSSVMAQFSALTASEQTYTRLDSILRSTAAQYPQIGSAVSAASAKMLEHARAGNTAAMSYSDLERAFNAMDWPTQEARDAAMAALELAAGVQDAGNSSSTAVGGFNAAASGADSVSSSAWAAVSAITAVANALRSLFGMSGGIRTGAAQLSANLKEEARIATLKGADKAIAQYWHTGEGSKFVKESQEGIDGLKKQAASATSFVDKAMLYGQAGLAQATLAGAKASLSLDVAALYDAQEAAKNTGKGGGGGGGGKGKGSRSGALSEEQKAVEKLNKTLKDRVTSLAEERIELALVATGQFETAEGARLMAEAMVQGGGAVDAQTEAMIRQIDVAAKLNEELTKAARDPVREWMDSVPNWLEAGKQIEMGAIDSLKGAISEFIKTGQFDINSLGEAILGTIADIVADKAVKELMTLMGRDEQSATGGFAGMLAGLFSSTGDTPVPGIGEGGADAGLIAGSQQAGTAISTAMLQAGQQVSAQISAAMTGAGTQAGMSVQTGLATGSVNVRTAAQTGLAVGSTNIRTAATTGATTLGQGVVSGAQQGAPILGQSVAMGAAGAGAGGAGGGGFLSGLGGWQGVLGMALGAFSEGGYSTSPVGSAMMPMSAFRNAPHYAQGTTNTSGIPAVLHPNEAVIPLSKGRKIPVDMGDSAGGGNNTSINQTFNITTNDADSFRRSKKQVAADMAEAGQRAVRSIR